MEALPVICFWNIGRSCRRLRDALRLLALSKRLYVILSTDDGFWQALFESFVPAAAPLSEATRRLNESSAEWPLVVGAASRAASKWRSLFRRRLELRLLPYPPRNGPVRLLSSASSLVQLAPSQYGINVAHANRSSRSRGISLWKLPFTAAALVNDTIRISRVDASSGGATVAAGFVVNGDASAWLYRVLLADVRSGAADYVCVRSARDDAEYVFCSRDATQRVRTRDGDDARAATLQFMLEIIDGDAECRINVD